MILLHYFVACFTGLEESLDRRRKWKALARLVQQDRTENAATAHEDRMKGLPASATKPSQVSDDDDEDLGEDFFN